MWTESASFGGVVIVKAGVMDNNALVALPPASETFTSRKPGWVKQLDNAVQFTEAFQQAKPQ